MMTTEQPSSIAQPRPAHRFGALAWTAFILGIVGLVGSPIIFLNNLTAVGAAVGVILGVVALFGTQKVLATVGVALCVAGITFTVLAQDAAVAEFDRPLGPDPAAVGDVAVADCQVVSEYGYTSSTATVVITNSTDEPQSYWATISLNDETGARMGEINAGSNSLAPGQSTTFSGMDATGTATSGAEPGPSQCAVVSVDRF